MGQSLVLTLKSSHGFTTNLIRQPYQTLCNIVCRITRATTYIRPSTFYVLEQLVRLTMSASVTINESPNKMLNLLRQLSRLPFFMQQSLQLKHHLRLVQQPFSLKLTRQFPGTPTLALEPVSQTNCVFNTLGCTFINAQFICSQMLSANHINNLLHVTTNLPTVCLIGPDCK